MIIMNGSWSKWQRRNGWSKWQRVWIVLMLGLIAVLLIVQVFFEGHA